MAERAMSAKQAICRPGGPIGNMSVAASDLGRPTGGTDLRTRFRLWTVVKYDEHAV
jgi:hypothetical protein